MKDTFKKTVQENCSGDRDMDGRISLYFRRQNKVVAVDRKS